MLEEPEAALYSVTSDDCPWALFAVRPSEIVIDDARGISGTYTLRLSEITRTRAHRDRITFQGRNRAWYSARNLTPTQVAEATYWLRRVGLAVERAA